MTTSATVTQDGMVYELDEYGMVMRATVVPEPKLIAPFWWEAHPVNTEAAHEATIAMGKGQP